jgi:hypothetical protein
MMGMDHNQRSNAVGFGPSYLPDGEGARHGGGTYTGNATEPTIQDYENFFGPSARDIKTDLQRFKRHGRWHLPDVLQGPNPWLTDRIDGLITDATNSPFTTKILPYRFKEEVDGKIKWNVWSFDEGMASRVPYESAARTLTQSKRSFAGYMVRQGMAIVLEHNFMMTPKGRENFKNQLNQLIGSIQYTNDLDVHMALILAPSYQKTMRERYYTLDKSASQMCREFADLFGMMQKNVNALDILIEEGKAILRTWGGPMPDFLLCNSKLTFQMTMTPDKTNYITQGIDGVKRLRAGPDLASYRGLSVIHTRSFAIETGQHPRDMLRRRVRTAEYYRILPNKKNMTREFEFYNEERDTWFTLSFHDLLKCARYMHDPGNDTDNASKIDAIYHGLSGGNNLNPQAARGGHEYLSASMHPEGGLGVTMLGRYMNVEMTVADLATMTAALALIPATVARPLAHKFAVTRVDIRRNSNYSWYMRGFTDNLGFHIIKPRDNELWGNFEARMDAVVPNAANAPRSLYSSFLGVGPLQPSMLDNIFLALKRVPLNDPFTRGNVAAPGTPAWYAAYTFYLEIFRRGGLPFGYVDHTAMPVAGVNGLNVDLAALPYEDTPRDQIDVTSQFLTTDEAVGSVNHPFHVFPENYLPPAYRNNWRDSRAYSAGTFLGRTVLLTSNLLRPLLCRYRYQGRLDTGINILCSLFNGGANDVPNFDSDLFGFVPDNMLLVKSLEVNQSLIQTLDSFFAAMPTLENIDGSVPLGELLGRAGVSTIPMFTTSNSHLFHPSYKIHGIIGVFPTPHLDNLQRKSSESDGHLSIDMLKIMIRDLAQLAAETAILPGVVHPWFTGAPLGYLKPAIPPGGTESVQFNQLFAAIRDRINLDPVDGGMVALAELPAVARVGLAAYTNPIDFFRNRSTLDRSLFVRYPAYQVNFDAINSISPSNFNVTVDLNNYFDATSPIPSGIVAPRSKDVDRLQDVEIVIVRPNIEHNMLGVIMGLGGNELGNTLWGQTELSVYDDSMHGIWGMSYKYHERAIVFNEKNLIRMWDIAYDGYNGGKDDTYVDWTDVNDEQSNSVRKFKDATLDLSKNYRGPSMMVMAYVHDRARLDDSGSNVYDRHFKRNWPSPIVFYDTYDENNPQQQRETLPIDYDNVQTVDVEEFRVFNNPLYTRAYRDYQGMMPEFKTLHITRKTAGQGSADAETGTDCLAFQGSMRIKEGGVIQEIQGSGHHGPDYVGVASVRAGKGQKVSGQAPTPYRIV